MTGLKKVRGQALTVNEHTRTKRNVPQARGTAPESLRSRHVLRGEMLRPGLPLCGGSDKGSRRAFVSVCPSLTAAGLPCQRRCGIIGTPASPESIF